MPPFTWVSLPLNSRLQLVEKSHPSRSFTRVPARAIMACGQRPASRSAMTTATRQKKPTRENPTMVTACGCEGRVAGIGVGRADRAVGPLGRRRHQQPAARHGAADRQAEAPAPHQQAADDPAQGEQTELHGTPDEERRRQLDATRESELQLPVQSAVSCGISGPPAAMMNDIAASAATHGSSPARRRSRPTGRCEARSTSTPSAPAPTRIQKPGDRLTAAPAADARRRAATRRRRG